MTHKKFTLTDEQNQTIKCQSTKLSEDSDASANHSKFKENTNNINNPIINLLVFLSPRNAASAYPVYQT